jgi:hypothetical protein
MPGRDDAVAEGAALRDVSWWRVVLAFAATMVVLYSMTLALTLVGGASIVWIFVYTIVSNAVWWGILLFPTRPHVTRVEAR